MNGRAINYANLSLALVAQGFDVLVFDKRNNGWSGGFKQPTGQDIIDVIGQLQTGCKAYGPEDDLSAAPKRVKDLLGAPLDPALGKKYTASTKPIVLFGHSMGSLDCMRAMALNYSDYQIEADFDQDGVYKKTRGQAAGYDIRGVIASSSIPGTHLYECDTFVAVIGGMQLAELQTNGWSNSNIYRSLDRWPGFMAIKPTEDYLSAPEGMIDIYNDRLIGYKKLLFLKGVHDVGSSDAYWYYYTKAIAEGAVEIFENSSVSVTGGGHTTLRKELAKIADPDAESGACAEAEKWWKKLKRRWLRNN